MLLLQETKHKEYSERGCTTIFSQNYSMLRSLCPFAGVGACCVVCCCRVCEKDFLRGVSKKELGRDRFEKNKAANDKKGEDAKAAFR